MFRNTGGHRNNSQTAASLFQQLRAQGMSVLVNESSCRPALQSGDATGAGTSPEQQLLQTARLLSPLKEIQPVAQ